MQVSSTKALVLLSGGQDSTTCLAWALKQFGPSNVHALTVNYGQRHHLEVMSAKMVVAEAQSDLFARHAQVDIPGILKSTSPLLSEQAPAQYDRAEDMPGGTEPTFVPCRNLLFLTIAANHAVAVGAGNLVIGVSQEDYGGYPDCREEFVLAFEHAVNLALFGGEGPSLKVRAPLMFLSKKETVELMEELGRSSLLRFSHTCYTGVFPPCGKCHACILRARGFHAAGMPDPLIVRAINGGFLPADYPTDGLVVK